jgi:hypothetical protein
VSHITASEWAALVAALGMTATASVGVYEGLFVMPRWFADPPRSLALIRNRATVKFWIPLQLLTAAGVVWAATANWHVRDARGLLVAAIVGYLLVWLSTAVYFVPNVLRFSKVDPDGPPSRELAARGRRWLAGTWVRQLFMLGTAVALLMTLAVL